MTVLLPALSSGVNVNNMNNSLLLIETTFPIIHVSTRKYSKCHVIYHALNINFPQAISLWKKVAEFVNLFGQTFPYCFIYLVIQQE